MSDVEVCNLARDGKVNDLINKISVDPGLVKLKDSVCYSTFFHILKCIPLNAQVISTLDFFN